MTEDFAAEREWLIEGDPVPVVDELLTLRAQRDAALALHRRTEVEGHFGACATGDCDHQDECPLVMIGVCNACFNHVAPLYEDDDQPWSSDVIWPCPTAAALGVQPEGSSNE